MSTHTMYAIREATPGPRWKALFDAVWPAYRAWYLQDGEARRPDLATAHDRLVRHMPELVPTWERLVALTGGDRIAPRMLTMWDAPAFLPGCSQAVLTGEQPALVRNYDYRPDLFEWVVYSSAFTGRKVIGTGDCLWGLLDGMNEDGLVVSLTYGGRAGSAPGFAVPLVVRYLLEVAGTVEEARSALAGMPLSMSYNLTITDRTGAVATAFVAPGMEPDVSPAAVATNHRGTVPEDPRHAAAFRSVERQRHLQAVLDTRPSRERLTEEFLGAPLYNRDYARGFGTLYTAVYRPDLGCVEYRWPDTSLRRTFDSPDTTVPVLLHQASTPPESLTGEVGDTTTMDLQLIETQELGALARAAMSVLAERGDQPAFQELLAMNAHVGECLGESARRIAANGSWSAVADLSGTSKQAAWQRWHG